jgi:antitoxin VapB
VCAERDGLIVALSRVASVRRDDALQARTAACADVFGRIAAATVAEATGAEIYASARAAYRAVGYDGEERLHHQGGAIGYRTREWVAHPESEDIVRAPQAFAWNPSITGTKVEETFVLHEDGRIQVLTHDPEWPSIPLDVRGTPIAAPGVWVHDA